MSADAAVGALGEPDALTRRCWRCLKQFPLDPDEPVGRPAEWWVCEPCHASLLGQKRTG